MANFRMAYLFGSSSAASSVATVWPSVRFSVAVPVPVTTISSTAGAATAAAKLTPAVSPAVNGYGFRSRAISDPLDGDRVLACGRVRQKALPATASEDTDSGTSSTYTRAEASGRPEPSSVTRPVMTPPCWADSPPRWPG